MASWLNKKCFSSYPPQGRDLALSHLAALRQIPVALLPVFLVELKDYDWKFPAEQQEVLRRIEFIGSNPSSLAGFGGIVMPPALDNADRTRDPQQFLAETTAYLWSSLQMDAYREAADHFVSLLNAATQRPQPAQPRLLMIAIGRDANPSESPLFQKLRPFGQVRTAVRTEDAAQALLAALRKRSAEHPAPYVHWYVDGGSALQSAPINGVTQLFYPSLLPINKQILASMMSCIRSGSGPEVMHTELAELTDHIPSAEKFTNDPRLLHFAVSLLTEGSGTQIFSTSFVQWATREVLRRAQPATVLVRFAPRQRQKPFNAMVAAAGDPGDFDADGSLIDADMSAYYAYLEMQRLPGAAHDRFVVWFEGHPQAFVAGPGIAAGSTNNAFTTMTDLLAEA